MKKKEEMVIALAKELHLRSAELYNERVETIYFGGGTPSVLTDEEIGILLDAVYQNYHVAVNPEITLEANPDDLSKDRIFSLSKSPINRLSIGIQSFFEEDLILMNRAHNAIDAQTCLAEATKYFDNISIDLIYGIPGMSHDRWRHNIETALSYKIPHISSYALTVEPKTALKKLIQTGKMTQPNDDVAQEQFFILVEMLQNQGLVHYELSNFGKPNFFSKNNSAYWLGKKYLGIGPSAHSYDGISRSWNVANNSLYLKSLQEDLLPQEVEMLTPQDRYNEYVMTGLRTIWGVDLNRVETEFGKDMLAHLEIQAAKYLNDDLLYLQGNILKTTTKGKFLTDGMASHLFLINLD